MDYIPLRPAFPKAIRIVPLLSILVVLNALPQDKILLDGALLLGISLAAWLLEEAGYALRLEPKAGQLTYGVKFFSFFFPQKTCSLQCLSSLSIAQLPNKYWAVQLQPEPGEQLVLDSRPTLDKTKERLQEIEKNLFKKLGSAAKS